MNDNTLCFSNMEKNDQQQSGQGLPAPVCSPRAWRSCAEWPDGLLSGCERPNITTDEHQAKDQAEAVCEMLEAKGLGGERIHFPVKTWVEEIHSENIKS